MPNPNKYDQPAEGGVEQVEKNLQKQSEPKENRSKNNPETKDPKQPKEPQKPL